MASPFHAGEQWVQSRVGVREKAEQIPINGFIERVNFMFIKPQRQPCKEKRNKTHSKFIKVPRQCRLTCQAHNKPQEQQH